MAAIPLDIFIARTFFVQAYQSVREQRRITSDVLDAARISVCIAAGFHMATSLNNWFYALSLKMSARTNADFKQSMDNLLGEDQETVWLYADGHGVEMPSSELKLGDTLMLDTGDSAPVVCRVIYGAAWVNEYATTGDVQAVLKNVGDTIHMASVVISGEVAVQVEDLTQRQVTSDVYTALYQAAEETTLFQRVGQKSGRNFVPWAIGLCAFTTPILGLNRATAFLCTGFGSHMRVLGPLALKNFLYLTVQHNILVKDGSILERASLVNAVVIDADVLQGATDFAQAADIIDNLRRRKWLAMPTFYLISRKSEAATRKMSETLGFNDYFANVSARHKGNILEQLRGEGKMVGYVSNGVTDTDAMSKAWVGISLASATTVSADTAQVILIDNSLSGIQKFFDIATEFNKKQSFSLAFPIITDIVDITTTLLIHLGITYSVLFNYSSLLLSGLNIRRPIIGQKKRTNAEEDLETYTQLPG